MVWPCQCVQEACDAAAADLARCKWLELESERQQAHADTLQERLAGMKIQETQLCTRLKQLEVLALWRVLLHIHMFACNKHGVACIFQLHTAWST
jgi:hypothetical protein